MDPYCYKSSHGDSALTLNIIYFSVKSPEITQALSEENFVAGNSGVISCVSDALPPAKHHWLFNGAELQPNKTTKYDLTARQDLIVHNLTQADTGTYTCVATNIYGQVSKDKDIKVGKLNNSWQTSVYIKVIKNRNTVEPKP